MSDALTIFLPVRDGGAYLSAAVASIRAQTDPDWQLIVLDNRSGDDTIERITAARDPRITLHEAQTPLSITDSWARILPLVAALPPERLVTLIGHDDLFRPGFVATIKRLAAEDPRATLYQTQFELIDGHGDLIRAARPVPLREEAGDLLAALCWGIRDSFGTGYGFRAGDYARVGGIPALPRLLFADHLLFSRLTALGHKRCAEEVGCSYRLHVGSASNGISPDRLANHALALASFVAGMAEDFPRFADSDRGRNAIAQLLARELSILEAPGVARALSAEARLAVNGLRSGLDGLSARRVAGPGHPIVEQGRRWKVALHLLRHRLGLRR